MSDSALDVKRVPRLSDILHDGEELEFLVSVPGGDGEPVEASIGVWIHKLTKPEMSDIAQACQAAAAPILAVKRLSRNSDAYQFYYAEIDSDGPVEKSQLAEWSIVPKMRVRAAALEAEVEGRSEYSENGLLDAARDQWNDSLKDEYFSDPDNPSEDSKRIFDLLVQFEKDVAAEIAVAREDMLKQAMRLSEDKLRDKVADIFVDFHADRVSLEEFIRLRRFQSVRRVDDHKKHYFESVEECDACSDVVKERIDAVIGRINLSTDDVKK